MNAKTPAWPQGKTCGVVVTVNFDAESFDLHETTRDNLYGRFSYGRYGMRAGLWRLLDVLRAHALRATFFVPALDAGNNPRAVEAILADAHEVAARGYALEDHSKLDSAERETLERAHAALTKIAGEAPVGWRAPFGLLSSATLAHLIDLGYLYDSSFQDDDYPYIMQSAAGKQIVELPQFQFLDDSTLYAPRHSHTRVLKTWKEEFDAMYSEGTFVNLTLHCRGDFGSGRAIRARVVDEFLTYAGRHPGVFFATCRDMASWWKQNHPQAEPVAS
ncbi:MAG: polysaccharide deacetylase family protein [Betaproteobacteria bacterium]|nr:polysaccharide deacetylase family protein [Betaproteobacteria bacterium]